MIYVAVCNVAARKTDWTDIKKTKLDISYNPLACYHGYQDDRKAFRMIHSEILEPIMKI